MFGDLIGREHAAGVLRAELERATASHGGLVLVAGEAGIGKTALVTGAAEEARALGALVLGGSCWDSENAPGYWPWVQVLRALRRSVGREEWEALRAAGDGTLGALLNEAGHAATAQPAPASESFELYDAVTTALVTASHRRPLVVIFDDLHWADTASLRLLRFATQHTWFERLLLVGTYRDAEVEPTGHPLHSLMMPLVAKATTLTLTGLAEHEVGALIERTSGNAAEPALLTEVHRRTGGNPFFVEQTARLWHSGGAVTGIPPGVGDAVRRRLGLLPERVTRLLTDAAVLGRGFHRQVLGAVAATPTPETDRLLDHAVTARLVTQRGTGRFAFAHDLVRETLYGELSDVERRRRHAAVVRALEPAGLADHVPPADLARHARLAGADLAPSRAVELLRAAAGDAVGRMAFEEAVGHHRLAYELAAALGARRRLLVGLDLAADLLHTGADEEAVRILREAAVAARELDDPGLLARVALSMYRGHGPVGAQGLGALRGETIREAHRRLIGARGKGGNGGHGGHGANAAGGTDEADEAATLDRLARELTVRTAVLARRGQDDDALAFSLWARHDAIWGPGTAAERQALTEEMITLARRSRDHDLEHFASSLRWVAMVEQGDPEYVTQLNAFLATVERVGLPRFRLSAAVDRCIIAVFQGRFEDAETHWERALEIGSQGDPHEHHEQFAASLSWQRLLLQGRFEELEGLRLEGAYGEEIPRMELLHGIAAAQRGDVKAVERHYEVARQQRYPRFVEAMWLRFQAQAAALSGDPARRGHARAALAPFRDQWAVSMFGFDIGGPMVLWIAVLDASEGRWDAAVDGFEAAAASADRLRARPWSVEARSRLVGALAGRGGPGDAEAASALLAAVEREAAELGMRHIPARLAAARTRLAGGGPGQEDAGPAAATGSENGNGQGRGASIFRFDGAVWTLTHAGRTVHMPDAKGLRDLHELLAHPGTEIPAVRLLSPEAGAVERFGGDPVLDDEAKARYRRHLDALDAEIDRVAEAGDAGRAAELDRERAALLAELRAAAGLGGRSRRLGDEAERARKTVTARIRDALRRLDERHPELAAHLRSTVTTGAMCAYRPEPRDQAAFRL
ncbi:ATP-binding protein [Streptomyces sp. SBT349]|uniref:ATP-binding protein n=1 Tax=Streptomyces sp. SBT349 TaxID=1580539 RepID=UPI00066B7BEC|nr:AAA family ATPase [Streptomyces sp. SBT349]